MAHEIMFAYSIGRSQRTRWKMGCLESGDGVFALALRDLTGERIIVEIILQPNPQTQQAEVKDVLIKHALS